MEEKIADIEFDDLKVGDVLVARDSCYNEFTKGHKYVIRDFYDHRLGVVLINDAGERAEVHKSNINIMFDKFTGSSVDHPSHYTQGGIECIDAMESAYGTEAVIMFCMCNAFKYQWRFNKKNGREDILKCQWYQNKMIELQNKLNNKNKEV